MEPLKITGGLYLVVDPFEGVEAVLPKVQKALTGGVNIVQIWNNFSPTQNQEAFINAICAVAHQHKVPVLINNQWQLLLTTRLNGIHFDELPDINHIRKVLDRPSIIGITCGNNLQRIHWANENNIDYISFCSMFPSSSAGVCEIVDRKTVLQARSMTNIPIFLAGGITLQNVNELSHCGADGVAVISGIMKAADPAASAQQFQLQLSSLKPIHHATSANR